MKLNEHLKSELKKLTNIGYVLDIGFGYPYMLIEILHIYDARKCIGADLIREVDVVSCSLVTKEIIKKTNIQEDKIDWLIRDGDSNREFYNSYKLYTTLVLEKEPLEFSFLKHKLELHFEKSIQDYLKNEIKFIPYYDVIIASKVLSHIDPDSDENWEWVLDQLINKLSDRGIIYLRLNSDDYSVDKNKGDFESSILSPFDEEKINKVKNKLNVLFDKILTRDDGKREYEIIGKKKTSS